MAIASIIPEGIPVIDLSAIRSKSEEVRLKTAQDLFAAFRDVGFVYLRNHGVPQTLVDEAFGWVRHYFNSMEQLLTMAECEILCIAPGSQREGASSKGGLVPQRLLGDRQREGGANGVRSGKHQ